MSRYNLEIEGTNNRNKQGMILLFLLAFVFLMAYQYETKKENTRQTVVSKDYEICLQAVCINRADSTYEECLYLSSPRICNVKAVKVTAISRNAKRLEIEPLSAKCEER